MVATTFEMVATTFERQFQYGHTAKAVWSYRYFIAGMVFTTFKMVFTTLENSGLLNPLIGLSRLLLSTICVRYPININIMLYIINIFFYSYLAYLKQPQEA